MAVRTVVSLGIPDHLKVRPSTADELSKEFDCDPRILGRILEHLASRGVVHSEPDGRYSLTGIGRSACSTDEPTPQSWLVRSLRLGTLPGDVNHSVVALLDVVRSGRTAFEEQHGESVWDRMTRMSMSEARSEFGHRVPVVDFEPIGQVLEAHGAATVCDVGSGNGRLARELLTRQLCSHCHVVDLAPMVWLAGELLDEVDAGRYSVAVADFMTDPLPAADLYILCDVLADWDDESATRLLRNVRRSCGSRSRVLVTELRIPSGAGDLFDATAGQLRLDIEMARPNRTADEISALGRSSGLRAVSTVSGQHRVAILFNSA